MIGDQKNFISALIVPNFDSVINYLKSLNNNISEPNAIIEHEEVIKLFEDEISIAMENFSNYEKVKKFTLLSEPFSIEKGEMTPKMSLVRKKILNNYSVLINKMYE